MAKRKLTDDDSAFHEQVQINVERTRRLAEKAQAELDRRAHHERTVTLDPAERDVIRLALWTGDVRRYVPEIMRICAKLDVAEPGWFGDPDVRDRVAANR